MKNSLYLCSILVAAILGGCGSDPSSSASPAPTSSKVLHVALAPSEDAEKMVAGFEPIRVQLAKDLGMEVTVDKVTDYASVIEAQKAGKVDLAWYGPLSLVLANQEAGVTPIIVGVEAGGNATYHSVFVVPSASTAKTIADLKGKKVAFVDPGSTSGNLVPRSALMKLANAKAEDFFGNLSYAGSHDAALLSLMNGNVEACAIEDITYDAKVKSRELDPKKFRILWTSDPIPQSPFGVRKGLDPALTAKIVDSFTSMSTKNVKMDMPGVGNFAKFAKADLTLYAPIAEMAKTLGLTKKDIVK